MGLPAHKPGTSPALHFPISAWVTHASHPSMRSNRLSPDQVVQILKEAEETQNAYVESFQGKLRDECLNGHWFLNLADARPRRSPRGGRPTVGCGCYSAFGYVTPEEFAKADRRRIEEPGGSLIMGHQTLGRIWLRHLNFTQNLRSEGANDEGHHEK